MLETRMGALEKRVKHIEVVLMRVDRKTDRRLKYLEELTENHELWLREHNVKLRDLKSWR